MLFSVTFSRFFGSRCITYQDAVRAQNKIENILLKNPNVVSVGVCKLKDKYCIRVGLNKKTALDHSTVKIGKIIVPIQTEVVGEIKAQ